MKATKGLLRIHAYIINERNILFEKRFEYEKNKTKLK